MRWWLPAASAAGKFGPLSDPLILPMEMLLYGKNMEKEDGDRTADTLASQLSIWTALQCHPPLIMKLLKVPETLLMLSGPTLRRSDELLNELVDCAVSAECATRLRRAEKRSNNLRNSVS